mmetsp:Transcript_10230/g.22511  ORF Transcript_10230/g.22511 Transcript_10230/m.22511 type:complete len:238 (+) Transcript_10230:175-888(+)
MQSILKHFVHNKRTEKRTAMAPVIPSRDYQSSSILPALLERNKIAMERTHSANECSQMKSKDIRRSRQPKVASNAAVRSRLLSKLGISKREKSHRVDDSQRHPRSMSNSFHEWLKGDFGEKDDSVVEMGSLDSISTASTASSCSSSLSVRSVSFATTVEVHPIAKRQAYSRRIRDTLWTSNEEMKIMTARNCYEFAAESWDWRKVANESEMILYNGELVHPAHFQPTFSLRHGFTPS